MSDKENFTTLYNSTYTSCLKFILSKCCDIDSSNDIIQEVYIDVYKIILKKGYDSIKNSEAFVIHIAKKKLAKYFKSLKKQRTILESNSFDNDEFNFNDLNLYDADIDKYIFDKSKLEDIANFIKTKPKDSQNIFFMHYYAEMTIKEIAEKLKINESTVKSRLYRLINEIREKGGYLNEREKISE